MNVALKTWQDSYPKMLENTDNKDANKFMGMEDSPINVKML